MPKIMYLCWYLTITNMKQSTKRATGITLLLLLMNLCVFADLDALTEENLRDMIDRAAAQASHPEAQAAAVERLQGMERKNVETARRLLGL